MKALLLGITLLTSISSFANNELSKSDFDIPAYNFSQLLDETKCADFLEENDPYAYSPVAATISREMKRLENTDIVSSSKDVNFVGLVRETCESSEEKSISDVLEALADEYLHPNFFTETYRKH